MKRITIVLIAAFLFAAFESQAQTKVSPDPFDIQMRAYKLALKNYDFQAATVALYNMLAIRPERADMNDSLALLYFAGERYAQSYLIGEEILKANPTRKDMLELVAVSKQNLGMLKESLADYEKLYNLDKSLYYLYQIATLQYQLKRFGECIASLDMIISNPEAAKEMVNIRLQSGSQEVPMNAAALNVKGICAMELNQEQIARENFTKALEIFPQFMLARGNLEAINASQKQTPPAEQAPPASTPAATGKPSQKK